MGIHRQVTRPAVFLDRDGVINRAFVRNGKPFPPASLDEFEILPGVAEALNALKTAGYLLFVATNQPDVVRGTVSRALVVGMNDRLKSELPIEAVLTCFHDDADRCDCRKPRPGLITAAARDWSVDLPKSFMVGDRWRDVEAGQRAGCRTVFIDLGYDEKRPESYDFSAGSVLEAAHIILKTGPLK